MANPSQYTPVATAMLLTRKVNMIASVVEFTIPKKTQGTDYACKLTIMDSSCQDRGLVVNFFAEDVRKLPHISSYGDIICLRKFTMSFYNGTSYASLKKGVSSFVLLGGKSCNDFDIYQSSSPVAISDNEKQLITRLRTWLRDHHFSTGANEYLIQLKEIKADKYFDLVCKILYVSEISEGWILHVWDGTDCTPVNFGTNEDAQPPLQYEKSAIARSVLCTFPRVGTVLSVLIEKGDEGLHLHLQPIGEWIRLRSISSKVQSGIWYAELTSYSSMRQLSHEDSIVKNRMHEYEERLASNLKFLPLSCSAPPTSTTVTTPDHAVFSTLRDVLIDSEVTSKYKCVVRVIAVYPRCPEEFIVAGYGSYCVRFTLEDPTARIEAYLYGNQGEKFFGGLPNATDLCAKFNKLLGISEEQGPNSRNPPWMQCCIFSYYDHEDDGSGSRIFLIQDTQIVG